MSLLTASEQERVLSPEPLPQPIIHVENVGVRFKVPHERIKTFKEYAIRQLQGKIRHETFWALKDVSLDVYPGVVFGFVGRNGAGKSTLLGVVAGVFRPTRGRAQVRGRVAPLLELGAGFHMELTGRENVFLNGALLGYSQEEMQSHFDQILAFAEIEEFIDAPIRTYSTGMVARLGFSVATAIRPDVLIVDEVLSVGDAPFQVKCKERIDQFRQQGTCILVVAHALATIAEMCDRAVWLSHGEVQAVGMARDIATMYYESTFGVAPVFD
jgi:ABC-type polysaccharide/polyol phosphate transport system ATPase subunit